MRSADTSGISWRKSSYSSHNGDCVEVGWRKSSYSSTNGDCVEVAVQPAFVHLRDSKAPEAGSLTLHTDGWHAFLGALHSTD
ncbi:DUF397 domain-containing protein [Tamaricihabitans halophyticus]|uniref:DUF397 domain-containing protein n=1 Tax=Tamaricihabitans halophyticus TaxID=1262583 RepID=UPI00104C1CDD|nr:DUF397 domain-containing protein [Tamaricihabitans halophyticus]